MSALVPSASQHQNPPYFHLPSGRSSCSDEQRSQMWLCTPCQACKPALCPDLTSSSFLQVGKQKSYFLLHLQPRLPGLRLPDGSERRLFCPSLLPACHDRVAADGGEAISHPSFECFVPSAAGTRGARPVTQGAAWMSSTLCQSKMGNEERRTKGDRCVQRPASAATQPGCISNVAALIHLLSLFFSVFWWVLRAAWPRKTRCT